MEKQNPTTLGQAASSLPSTDVSQKRRAKRKTLIEKCQAWIFAAYRVDQFCDVEGYIDCLNHVLGQYPDDVILYISDPRTGIQRTSKFPPTVAEMVAACDARMQEIAKRRRYENWGSANKLDEPARIAPPREERPTYEELKEKFGENFGLTPAEPPKPPKAAPSWQEIQTFYERNPDRAEALIRALDRQGPEPT